MTYEIVTLIMFLFYFIILFKSVWEYLFNCVDI